MNKPAYKVPSMEDIKNIPWNGFNVVSTFSGAGGSCLGYRMAGYRVLWANEFIPAAQQCYRANHTNSILDTRDIRLVQPEDILKATGLRIGEIDIFDGSPPCAAFSTAGKREAGWAKVKKYSDTRQRVDDLFFEYTRLIKGTQPKVFVAENVSGLIKGTAKGYFLEILKALKSCGYNVKCKVLDAQWLGVPQMRQRTIFVGVRNDLNLEPIHPKPLSYQYSVRDAWGDSLKVEPIEKETSLEPYKNGNGRFWHELKPGEGHEKRFNAGKMPIESPAFTITQSFSNPGAGNRWHPLEFRCLSLAETRRICSFPDDFRFDSWASGMERMGRAVPPVMMSHIAKTIQLEILEKL
jgi:DNA (cytosine-5)-methyltransferase 1